MPPQGIMFHHFHGPGHPVSQGSIGAEQLEELLERLGAERILPAREWLERSMRGTLEEGDRCLTFDDNLRCQYDLALPVLRRRGMTAFWFVSSSVLQGRVEAIEVYRTFRTCHFRDVEAFYEAFLDAIDGSPLSRVVEAGLEGFNPLTYLKDYPFYSESDRRFRFIRDEILGPARFGAVMDALMADTGVSAGELARNLWMDADCLRDLHAGGHVVGLHSHTHPTRLERLSLAGQWEEYSANYEHLRGLLGERPVAMSHPCNSYNEQTLAVLRRLGIRLGFRSNTARPRTCELDWPREDHANLLTEVAV